MQLDAVYLRQMVRQTLVDPQGAARALVASDPPGEARWLGLAVVAVLSALLGQAGVLMMAGGRGVVVFGGGASVAVQGALLLVTVYAVHGVGRLFGGGGAFRDALLLVGWVQFLMVILQAVQLGVMVLVPPLGGFVALASGAVFLWVLTNFVAALHGFSHLGKVFGMVLVTFMAAAFVLAFLLALLGVQAPGMADA